MFALCQLKGNTLFEALVVTMAMQSYSTDAHHIKCIETYQSSRAVYSYLVEMAASYDKENTIYYCQALWRLD